MAIIKPLLQGILRLNTINMVHRRKNQHVKKHIEREAVDSFKDTSAVDYGDRRKTAMQEYLDEEYDKQRKWDAQHGVGRFRGPTWMSADEREKCRRIRETIETKVRVYGRPKPGEFRYIENGIETCTPHGRPLRMFGHPPKSAKQGLIKMGEPLAHDLNSAQRRQARHLEKGGTYFVKPDKATRGGEYTLGDSIINTGKVSTYLTIPEVDVVDGYFRNLPRPDWIVHVPNSPDVQYGWNQKRVPAQRIFYAIGMPPVHHTLRHNEDDRIKVITAL